MIKREGAEKIIEQKILKALPKEASAAVVVGAEKKVSIVRYWPAAAVLLLMLMSTYVILKTDVVSTISTTYSNINPFGDTAEPLYSVRVERPYAEVTEVQDEIDTWLESIPEEPVAVPKVEKVVVKRFHVIGGCFKFKANANKLMRRLKRKGFEPQFVGTNGRGLQRVAFGSYETRREARKALKEVKRDHMKSAWLYVSRK